MTPPVGCPDAFDTSPRLTQDSIVKFWRCRLTGLPTTTPSPAPSNRKACPTTPGKKVVFPCKLPLFPPRRSLPFPSAGHQLTSPVGAATQVDTHLPAPPAW